jgi:glycosyltransferase involved in cell wall biosynthesis
MPVLHVVHITTVPETLRFLTGHIKFLLSRGCRVSAVSSPGWLLDEFARETGIETVKFRMYRRITPMRDLATIFHLWRYFRRSRPHIVHAHTPKAGLLGMLAALLAGVPVRIYHIHGLPFMTAVGLRRRLLISTEKVSCRVAHCVLAVSHSIRKVAVTHALCPARKIETLLGGSINGVDAAGRFNPTRLQQTLGAQVRTQYGIPKDALVLGFIGRIVGDKGITELVAAWRSLRSQFPKLHLLVVGYFEKQDPVSAEVEKILRTDQRIHLAGAQRETPQFYAAMDLVVLPTYREGFPTVPLEAAAMERPVVATLIPGCIDAVQDGITGSLVPPRNVELLVLAITQYLEDPGLRSSHGLAARQRVLSEFRPDDIWQEMGWTYSQLLRSTGQPLLPQASLFAERPRQAG